jgi:quercetin dioxygenase-like cupin family protein
MGDNDGLYSAYVSMRSLLKGASMNMKRMNLLIGCTLVVGVMLGLAGSRMSSAQDKDHLKGGKILQRMELKGAPGWEAILVDRTLPPGVESGNHTQSGNEIVYIETGSVMFETPGKEARTLKPGESFTTVDGQVHNVKNASKSEPAKALAFYVAKKGTPLEDLSVPAK